MVESLEMIFVEEKNINTVNKYQSIIHIEKETVDIYLGYENQQNVNVTLLGWFSLNLVSSLLDCRIKEAEFSFMTSIVVFDVVHIWRFNPSFYFYSSTITIVRTIIVFAIVSIAVTMFTIMVAIIVVLIISPITITITACLTPVDCCNHYFYYYFWCLYYCNNFQVACGFSCSDFFLF